MNRHFMKIFLCVVSSLLLAGALPARGSGDGRNVPAPAMPEAFTVSSQQDFLLFTWKDSRVDAVNLMVWDGREHLVSDSGETAGGTAVWDTRLMSMNEEVVFELRGWDGEGRLVQRAAGRIVRGGPGEEPLAVRAYDVTGDFTISGNLGVGTETPERAVHIRGSNAVFRMDRSADTAAFMLVRTDTSGIPQKTFVVGANASGTDQGEFVINDLGTAVAGGGTRRMTIDNAGDVTFSGHVEAAGFATTAGSSSFDVLTAVHHDASLDGRGTPTSLLGIADGGVTPAKIGAGGSSSGQVLTSDGAAASWQTPPGGGGLNSVAHTAALYGDGTTGAPLGIAGNAITTNELADDSVGPAKIKSPGIVTANLGDDTVTQAKLYVRGTAASGNVLGTDGTNLSWQADSLALPFFRSVSTAAAVDAFKIENTGSGRAIQAVAASETAVWGVSNSGQGVVGWSTDGDGVEGRTVIPGKSGVWGHSALGYGVTGASDQADGVYGTTGSAGKSGVWGYSANGSGVTGSSEQANGVVGITSSEVATAAGVYAGNTGGSIAVYSDGDLYVTGALRGDVGPGYGGPFPRPAWDSGWVNLEPGTATTYVHNIGGDTDDYVVDLQLRQDNLTVYGATHYVNTHDEYIGAYWYFTSNTAITVRRSGEDPIADQIRVRIWVCR